MNKHYINNDKNTTQKNRRVWYMGPRGIALFLDLKGWFLHNEGFLNNCVTWIQVFSACITWNWLLAM